VQAWPHEGIVPLEVWDLMVDGRSLFACRAEATFYDALAAAVLALRRGEATREEGTRLGAVPWDAVLLVGGAVDAVRARAAFAARGIALEVSVSDPCYVARLALEVLAEHDREAVVVDVGQTAIKAAGPHGVVHRRHEGEVGEQAALASAIAAATSAACREHRPTTLLLALPCEVTMTHGAPVLGASTLPTAGDGSALGAALRARLPWACETWLVNDAVLAAWALARRRPGVAAGRARLVLTLGFGVGAALIERPA
jgi:hypothetical protein